MVEKNMDKSIPGSSKDEVPIIAEYCLVNLPTVLDLILCNLNAKDLSSASCVCWFWHDAAQRLWSKRLKLVTKLMYMADGEQINESSMAEMANSVCDYLLTSLPYPQAALVYFSRSDEYMARRKDLKRLLRKVYSLLPQNCALIGGLAGGIIGCSCKKSLEIEQDEGISTLILPRKPDISINQFFITMSDVSKAGKSVKKWEQLLGFSRTSDVKLILLHACCEADGIEQTVRMISETLGDQVIIAGGMMESVIHKDKLRLKGISGIAFTGNVCASLVIQKSRGEKDKFIDRLEQMKASNDAEEFSVIFMFTCVARGFALYSEYNIETSWISEVFPSVPVVGMFSFGEIGSKSTQADRDKDSILHSYSTVLCLCKV